MVQHECDYLDGVLFPDRLEDNRAFGFREELEASGLLPGAESPAPEQPRGPLDAMRRQLEQHSALEDLGPLFGPQDQGYALAVTGMALAGIFAEQSAGTLCQLQIDLASAPTHPCCIADRW